ncbi:MAG: UDP-2,3-diacylglucosamine diphosphatase [Chitinophagaceae bacterium]
MQVNKKIYFLSDFHLGAPNAQASLVREKKVVSFLNSIKHEASAIFIVGDMFDFWFEYKNVVPKGYTRILGKLAELSDLGIQLHFFVGNHDMWMSGYFEQEFNMPVYHHPKEFEFNGQRFLIGHGDGLGPHDYGYKLLKKVFRNKFCQFLFGFVHPFIGINIANYFSRKSRQKTGASDAIFLGEEKEWLVQYCKKKLETEEFDYFIFGHRHLPLNIKLNNTSTYINLGDWITHFTYAVFDGEKVELKKWED